MTGLGNTVGQAHAKHGEITWSIWARSWSPRPRCGGVRGWAIWARSGKALKGYLEYLGPVMEPTSTMRGEGRLGRMKRM